MTTLLIFEALEEGRIHLNDEVVTSAHAKSMGGSQVFLEEGEKQTVDTLLKCILVSSGNDASVAMAEYIAGSEEEFVRKMNDKANELGMKDTHFIDCCGLTDSDEHYSCAFDIGIMSRELLNRYPKVLDYTTIWMENIIHETQKGRSEFGLANTNKLLRSYEGCNGLKTGSTSKALFCISAAAKRNNIQLISVVMAGADSKTRFADAANLLNYGFGKCKWYTDTTPLKLPEIIVKKGKEKSVSCKYETDFSFIDTQGRDFSKITRELELVKETEAPVKCGEYAGKVKYKLDGELVGVLNIVFQADVEKAGGIFYLKQIVKEFMLCA